MTSNIGSEHIINTLVESESNPQLKLSSQELLRQQVTNALRAHFRPEFLNRVDELIIFDPLKKTELRQIVSIQIQHIERMLADQKITIELSAAAQDYLADVGYDPVYGARPLKRAIQRELQNPIATKILETTFGEGDKIYVDCVDRTLTFSNQPGNRDRSKSAQGKKSVRAMMPDEVIPATVGEK